ncbi:MAG: hypothetical protein QM704_28015 [Anaeromyxobacteraceae bacterium]
MIAAAALALAVALPAPAPSAPSYPVQSRAQKTEVKLGEPFGYELEVRHPAGLTLALPKELPQEPFHLEPGACRREPVEGEPGEVTSVCSLTASLFALGPHEVPAVALELTGPGGAKETLRVSGTAVTGVGLLDPKAPPEQLQLRDLSPPAPLMVRSLRLVWWTLGALGALAVALLAWRAWRRRAVRAAEPPPPVPPHERLARRLAALEGDRLGERGHAREHFYRLSEMVREYLGALLGVPALDLTTEELLERTRDAGDPRLDPADLRPFLEDVDLVKFARAEAGPGECASGVAWARALLDRTRPPEPAAPPPPPGAGEARR